MTTPEENVTTSPEDRFFGVKHTIGDEPKKTAPVADDVEVEEDIESTKVTVKPEAKPKAYDDDDDELSSYSEKVQKRINKMTYQYNAEKRRADAAEKVREEALKVAQNLHQRTQQYEDVINKGEAHLVAQFKGRAQLAVQQAQSAYRNAYESGDTDGVIKAQSDLITAQAEWREANNYEGNYNQRSQQYQNQRQWAAQQRLAQTAARPSVPPPSYEASAWAEENKWFGDPKHKDMTALAYGVHETLIREKGLSPDSPEYFQEIDRSMRTRFPEYFEGSKTTSRPNTVVASGERNNGSKPRKFKLTSSQVHIAKRLGLTNEQYARQCIKEGM